MSFEKENIERELDELRNAVATDERLLSDIQAVLSRVEQERDAALDEVKRLRAELNKLMS